MTDERYDYYQAQTQRNQAAHRTPISPPRMASEAENHEKDGPCKTIVLPNLPSVAGRVKYAMGAMNVGQFSQRTGISISYLSQLCNGKAKTLSAFNAKRIAGASDRGVTVGWLLGMGKPVETPPEPKKPDELALPDLPDFWARLKWALKRDGRPMYIIEAENDLRNGMFSETLRLKRTPLEERRKILADSLNVPVDWLCAGLDSNDEIYKKRGAKTSHKKSSTAENKTNAVVPKQPLQEAPPPKAPIPQSTGTHLHFEGVYSGDTLAALVSVLKGTYRVSLTIDEVEEAK